MFRLIGFLGDTPNYEKEVHQDKMPILMQHGSFSDDYQYIQGTFVIRTYIDLKLRGETLPVQLALRGYDVFVVSNRGYGVSNTNEKDGEWTVEEKWDFNFADMGNYDVPACVDKVLQITGKPKVTLTGYSQGTASIIYALAKHHDFYVERLNRAILFAPCLFATPEYLPYELESMRLRKFKEINHYYWSRSDEDVEGSRPTQVICDEVGGRVCGYSSFNSQGQNMGSLLYFAQLSIEQRY